MAVYIAADTNFCESAERDQELIKNWNQIIKEEEDLVLLFGDILYTKESWEKVEDIFNKLKGKKKVIGIHSETNKEEAEHWKRITNHKCFLVNAAVSGEIKNNREIVTIYSSNSNALRDGKLKEENRYGAAPRSLSKQKELFENNVISISIDDWGKTPIEYMRIPQMIDDMLLFESMENKEENLNGKN